MLHSYKYRQNPQFTVPCLHKLCKVKNTVFYNKVAKKKRLNQGERRPPDFALEKFVPAFEPGLVTGVSWPPDFNCLTSVAQEKLAYNKVVRA